jgi:hypothetical protein
MRLEINKQYYNKWADKIIDGLSCQDYIEEVIQEYWYGEEWYKQEKCPCLFDIGGDPYDHSLELDVAYITSGEEVAEFCKNKVTKEFVDMIREHGARGFWINFYPTEDNTQYKKSHEIIVSSTNDENYSKGWRDKVTGIYTQVE